VVGFDRVYGMCCQTASFLSFHFGQYWQWGGEVQSSGYGSVGWGILQVHLVFFRSVTSITLYCVLVNACGS
jgi:hypothetical protein